MQGNYWTRWLHSPLSGSKIASNRVHFAGANALNVPNFFVYRDNASPSFLSAPLHGGLGYGGFTGRKDSIGRAMTMIST